jgi:hypothetical protein
MGKKNNNNSGANGNKSTPAPAPADAVEVIPDEFKKVICDFINDFALTFPEYSEKLDKYSSVDSSGSGRRTLSEENITELYQHCKKVYPVRFFDVLYKNTDMFTKCGAGASSSSDTEVNVHFLPEVNFANVWNTPDISDKTRETIMKYLQLILFSIITNVSDQNSFGDTAKLFEAINEDELKGKLDETFKNMQDLFTGMGMGAAGETGEAGEHMKDLEKLAEQFKNFAPEGIDMSKFPNFNFGDAAGAGAGTGAGSGGEGADANTGKKPDIPNPEAVHDHISKLLNGKIGALAKEIAEETAGELDLGIDLENPEQLNMGNVFQKLFKNPGKLMNMVKNVGQKLDDKFKKGDIKESELMQEASELLSNMKNMPGMGNLSSMLSQLGMKGMGGLGGKGGKVNIGAMQNHLQQNMKNAKMKERMHQKLQQRQEQQQQQQQQQPQQRPATSVYTASSGETIVQTPRVPSQANATTNQLPAQAISQAESNLVEWAQAHMTPSSGSGSGQKKKKKNKK